MTPSNTVKHITPAERIAARTTDPTAFLRAHGFTVKRIGRNMSVSRNGEELYRITCLADGHYVWTDHYGSRGGDNIDLVRAIEPSTSFIEAACKLLGKATVFATNYQATHPNHKLPILPKATAESIAKGRAYLQSRAISPEVIQRAEACGMVRYAPDGVLFCGFDTLGRVRNVTRRASIQTATVPKRDLKHSDKRFPPILPGSSSKVWLVEGGTDALALHELAKRQGAPAPTVIVTGGAHVTNFFEMPHIQALLTAAPSVTIAAENEKDATTQAKTDAAHQIQAQHITAITGKPVTIWAPKPSQGKDVADLNERRAKAQNFAVAKKSMMHAGEFS